MSQGIPHERYEELKKKTGGNFDSKLFAVVLIAFMTRQHIVISTEAINYAVKSIELVRISPFFLSELNSANDLIDRFKCFWDRELASIYLS